MDPQAAAEFVGSASLRAAGRAAQQRAQVVLKNSGGLLPLPGRPRVYAEGIDPAVLATYAEVAATPPRPTSRCCA